MKFINKFFTKFKSKSADEYSQNKNEPINSPVPDKTANTDTQPTDAEHTQVIPPDTQSTDGENTPVIPPDTQSTNGENSTVIPSDTQSTDTTERAWVKSREDEVLAKLIDNAFNIIIEKNNNKGIGVFIDIPETDNVCLFKTEKHDNPERDKMIFTITVKSKSKEVEYMHYMKTADLSEILDYLKTENAKRECMRSVWTLSDRIDDAE